MPGPNFSKITVQVQKDGIAHLWRAVSGIHRVPADISLKHMDTNLFPGPDLPASLGMPSASG